jgi:hypothetical protein
MEPFSTLTAEPEPAREEAAPSPSQSTRWLLVLLLSVEVFAITAIPYAIGFFRPPPGMVFGGLLESEQDPPRPDRIGRSP